MMSAGSDRRMAWYWAIMGVSVGSDMKGECGGLSEESSDDDGGEIEINNRQAWAETILSMA
jgi:hypothetical protein